ncbi:DUF6612 family protein [Halalkalibacter krulwichiae]|uniref:Lipoprotein n=1 Tax=Halalkalibacter krulwichiae TaxID=199441 RepID=A0A1X9MF52_9BACI|nr:DUF6612 family protein [Halalkalibacter krulwichiae]ARK32075.1 hypothetical protein BkAM31D_20765 [Halalkalibacter krulwichiae]
MGNFKHWLVILCGLIALSACSESTSVESTDPKPNETNEAEFTVEEILQKSIEAMNDVQSLSTEMNMIQEMELPQDEQYSSNILVYMELTQEPFNMYQKISMDLPEVGLSETELYMVEDTFYFKDPMEESWFTYPDDLAATLRELESEQFSTNEQLDLLLKNADLLSYTEDEEHYIITVEGSPDLLQDFAQELNGLVHDEMTGDINQLMMMSDIQELNYTLYIEKDTFMQTKMDMSMAFELSMDGEQITIKTDTQASFDNFNGYSEITVPEAVIKEAEEFNLEFTEFEDFEEFDVDEELDD